MKIQNITNGPRGVNTLTGLVILAPGQEADLELSPAEQKGLAKDWFKVNGKKPKAEDENDAADEQARIAAEKEAADAAAKAEAEQNAADVQTTGTLKAQHRGAGSFSIVDADGNEVVEKISKSEAEKFNALSDEDKAAYVESKQAK